MAVTENGRTTFILPTAGAGRGVLARIETPAGLAALRQRAIEAMMICGLILMQQIFCFVCEVQCTHTFLTLKTAPR